MRIFIPLFIWLSTQFAIAANPFDDPYIVCSENVPGPAYGPWPPGYSRSNYMNNLQLCSDVYGNQETSSIPGNYISRNVGCRCHGNFGNPLCNPLVADANLYGWQGLNFGRTFPGLCQEYLCQCTTEQVQAQYKSVNQMGNATFAYHNRLNPRRPTGVVPPNKTDATSDITFNPFPPDETLCGYNCTTNADCGGPGGDSCMCSVASTQVIPGSGPDGVGIIEHIASCIFSEPNRKREESPPCPCNTTYVSHSCCNVHDGLVWEGPEAYLGRLKMNEHDL